MTRELKEHGILFSSPLVRALLAGTKARKLYPRPGETPDSPEHLLRRLANGATLDESTGCWVWTRAHNNFGYGTMTVAGKSTYVHRLAYRLLVGEIPTGLDLMHSCDRPSCLNPEHLTPGTRSKNMSDCHARGRSRIPSPRMRGESNGQAKITAAIAEEIRARRLAGETQRSVGARYGISQSQVSSIVLGKAWVSP